MMTFEKVLGLEKSTLIVLAVIFVILLLAIFYLYLATVFVGKKYVKVVERMGKPTIAINPGWKIIVPLRDKVVAKISTTDKIFSNTKELTLATKNDAQYKLSYSVTYKVVDGVSFYTNTDTFAENFENKIVKALINFYSEKDIASGKDFYSSANEELCKLLTESVSTLGVEVNDIVFNSVNK